MPLSLLISMTPAYHEDPQVRVSTRDHRDRIERTIVKPQQAKEGRYVTAHEGLHRLAAPRPGDGPAHDIRRGDAGWQYVGFAEHRLGAGATLLRPADDHEVAVIVMEGATSIEAGGQRYTSLGSRETVFDGPAASRAAALARAPRSRSWPRRRPRSSSRTRRAPTRATRGSSGPTISSWRHRGHGVTERRIHHLLPPTAEAGRLILFEVFTPGGNWSSYPPHKHDTEDPPREAYLEELYYYRFARPEGWAFARVYTADRSLDESFAPRDRDVVLVPRGYHPVGAPAGYDAYYLNVMAGPHRAWHFTLDPDHAWLMDWDPRPRARPQHQDR